jgi:hypothetical protein
MIFSEEILWLNQSYFDQNGVIQMFRVKLERNIFEQGDRYE